MIITQNNDVFTPKYDILRTYFNMEKIFATLSLERELRDELQIIDYEVGNGDIHFHSQIEICIVEKGTVEALVNNSKKLLQRGDVAIALSYDSHRYVSNDNAGYCVLILPGDVCEKFYSIMQAQNLSSPFICGERCNTRIMECLSYIKKESTNKLLCLGYIYLMLGLIKDELSADIQKNNSNSELLSRLLIYIHKNYNKKLTLSSISKVFGYHPAYISSYFKAELNIGIMRYVNVVRLKNAVLLMRQKKQTVTQIAMDCGFSSTRTFYRAFRQEFGCSPKDYKEKLS